MCGIVGCLALAIDGDPDQAWVASATRRSADGHYWMVYNGEIYNYLELGAELREQALC